MNKKLKELRNKEDDELRTLVRSQGFKKELKRRLILEATKTKPKDRPQ